MRYINVEKLKHEIERLKRLNSLDKDKEYAQFEFDVAAGYDMALYDIESFINFLQDKSFETNLDKEILNYIGDEISCESNKWTWHECNEMIHYFFNLGLNIKNEE